VVILDEYSCHSSTNLGAIKATNDNNVIVVNVLELTSRETIVALPDDETQLFLLHLSAAEILKSITK